jgi:RND family efflux transporter MFP subunit
MTDPVAPAPRRSIGIIPLLLLAVFVVALGLGIRSGIQTRLTAGTVLKHETEEAAIPIVNVVSPKPGAPTEELVLPGNTLPFTDTPIYARTNGYLKKWYFDMGAHVKQGDLLADIETPEIDQQLRQASADLETAHANLHLAETTAERWQVLLKTDSVSKQETDEKLGDLRAKKAVVESQSSNVRRLQELKAFQKVYAPFDGIITARNTDLGALIDAGANSSARPLFRLAAIGTLRVYVAVPEVYSRAALPGSPAMLTLDEFPGRSFAGKLVRTANAIDPASHTLLMEVSVDNPSGQLLPGAYVAVHLKLPKQIHSLIVPSNTLLFRSEGLSVGVVRDGKAVLVPVKIGRDYGATVEIVAGLQPSDAVILDPSDSLTSGTPVQVNKQ